MLLCRRHVSSQPPLIHLCVDRGPPSSHSQPQDCEQRIECRENTGNYLTGMCQTRKIVGMDRFRQAALERHGMQEGNVCHTF